MLNKNFNILSIFIVAIIFFSLGYIFSIELAQTNNIVVKILNDENYYNEVISLIRNANNSIYIMIFKINYYTKYINSPSNNLLREVSKAKKRGLDIKIILDKMFSNNEVYEFLKNNSINFRVSGNVRVSHAKFLIIDNHIVIIGSTNWSFYSLRKNREANVIIDSKTIANKFTNYFFDIWNESSRI